MRTSDVWGNVGFFFPPGDICGVLYISWYFKAYELFSDQLYNLSVGVASISSQRSGCVGEGCLSQLFPFHGLVELLVLGFLIKILSSDGRNGLQYYLAFR